MLAMRHSSGVTYGMDNVSIHENLPAWSEMIEFLVVSHRLRQIEIARLLGTTAASVSRLRNGRQQPGYQMGARLVAMYRKAKRIEQRRQQPFFIASPARQRRCAAV